MAKSSKGTFRNIRLNLEELESRELPSAVLSDALSAPNSYATDHVLVRWLNDTPVAADFAAKTESLGNNTYSVQLKSSESVADALTWYRAQTGIDYAQADSVIRVAKTANDTYASQQWALNNIGAATAWNYTTGSKQTIVAVIDTGVDYTHPDLAANMWSGLGYNFVSSNSNPMDDNGHGTHVAGIIGAIGNNSTGVAGVNWNVQIMSLKFMDSTGSGYTSNAVKAMYYAVDHGAKIINDSWGSGTYDAALASAIQYAQSRGVIVVDAAGNSSTNIDATPFYPASTHYSNVISVAASDQNNNLASFSNYGANTVDIAAPGVSILSTYTNNRYAYYSGTSMAAPYVTGAAALIWSQNPTWSYSQVISDLLSNTTYSAGLSGKVKYGELNVGKAVQSAAPAQPATPVQPTPPAPSVSQPPSVTSNPSNQAIGAGGTAAFTAAAANATTAQWQVSTDGGKTWSNLSNGGYYSGVNSTTLTVSGALTTVNGYQYRAVFSNAAGLSAATASAQLAVTSTNTYNGYVHAYYSYIYAYYAYATGGGQYAYTAYVNAYYSYYYAYYADYYNSIGNSTASSVCSYYSQYYSNQAAYYSWASYVTTGNVYAYYADYFASYAAAYSANAMRGY